MFLPIAKGKIEEVTCCIETFYNSVRNTANFDCNATLYFSKPSTFLFSRWFEKKHSEEPRFSLKSLENQVKDNHNLFSTQ